MGFSEGEEERNERADGSDSLARLVQVRIGRPAVLWEPGLWPISH